MPEYVLSEVLKQGFDKPTPIQSQGWPMALKGRNMVGISATGSGKTLAFLLPAMIHINAQVSVCKRKFALVFVVGYVVSIGFSTFPSVFGRWMDLLLFLSIVSRE